MYYIDMSMCGYNLPNLTQPQEKQGLCVRYNNSSTDLSTVIVDKVYLSSFGIGLLKLVRVAPTT